jgi:hypothetical protein
MSLVTGYFDVLVASQVRTLERLAAEKPRPLMAVVLNPPAQILTIAARAELAAALAVIDYVLPAGEERPAWLEGAVSLEAEHEDNRRELIAHVHRRQAG